MAKVPPMKIEFDIKVGVVVRPGDTLIVALSEERRALTAELADEAYKMLKAHMPSNVKVVIIPEAELAVYQP
jgi:leucyl aminopeptidase (aminopeptidase T)